MTKRPYDTAAAMRAAEDRLDTLTLESTEMEIIEATADYLLAHRPPYRLSIFHDPRPRATKYALQNLKEVSRPRRSKSDHRSLAHAKWEVFATGPCIAVSLDWSRKGVSGITTSDPEYARRWITDATFFGYCVYRDDAGLGNVREVRKRLKERIEDGYIGLHNH